MWDLKERHCHTQVFMHRLHRGTNCLGNSRKEGEPETNCLFFSRPEMPHFTEFCSAFPPTLDEHMRARLMHSVALFSMLIYLGCSRLWLRLTAGFLWEDHNNVRSTALLQPQATVTVSHTLLNTHTEPRPGHLPLFRSLSLFLFSYLSTSVCLHPSCCGVQTRMAGSALRDVVPNGLCPCIFIVLCH